MRTLAWIAATLTLAVSPLAVSAQPNASQTTSNAQAMLQSFVPMAFAGLSLEQAETISVALSPDVAIARSRLESARASLAAARAGFVPSLISAYASNPQAGSAAKSTVTQTLFDVGLQETLGNLAGYLPAFYQAQAIYNSTQAQEATAERLERIHAATLYFAALSARAAAVARGQALDLARAQQRAAERRFRSGDAPRVDVVRAEVATAQALAQYESAQAADDNASEALKIETGYTGELMPVAGALPAPLAFTSSQEAVSTAIATRSEILSAKQDVTAANAAVSAAKAAGLPALTVSAGYAKGLDTGQPISGPVVNAAFEFPLNGSQTARVRQARSATVEAQARMVAAQRLVTSEVSISFRNLTAATQTAAASTKARIAAQEELQATQTGYGNGASSSLDVAIASVTYTDARISELSALYGQALARTTLQLEVQP